MIIAIRIIALIAKNIINETTANNWKNVSGSNCINLESGGNIQFPRGNKIR